MRLALVAAAASLSGCFLVTDVDRFQQAVPSSERFYDLVFTIRGADSHVNELFELRVVDENKNIVMASRATPLGAPSATFNLPLALPKSGSFTLSFGADHNANGAFDPPRDDHSWTLDLKPFLPKDPADNVVRVTFDHSLTFQPMEGREVGRTARVRFTKMGAYRGKRAAARISDGTSRQLTGAVRTPVISQDDFTLSVPGVVDPGVGTRYTVLVTLDDGNGGALEGYRLEKASEATGLEVDFDPTRDQGLREKGVVPPP